MLTDSPWAKPALIPAESQVDISMLESKPSCNRCEAQSGAVAVARPGTVELSQPVRVTVRWHSSLPVKQAWVRLRFGEAAHELSAVAQYLDSTETAYVVGISGLPAGRLPSEVSEVKSAAGLRLKNGTTISASHVDVAGEHGNVLLLLHFPRDEAAGGRAIQLEDEQVEVQFRLGASNVRRSFKLKDMCFEGKLEL
jgi:hypothetical protein